MLASASFPALGTTATVVVDDASVLAAARDLLQREVTALDRACSRFRPDSELMQINAARGRPVRVSQRCVDAIEVALRAARSTDGIVDPTVGTALRVLGYDRDFARLAPDGPPLTVRAERVPGWHVVEVDRDAYMVRVPEGVELDLGATAKALGADGAARAIHAALGTAVLVSLGGDIAVDGSAPAGGWPIRVADDHTATGGGECIAINAGGLATSGIARRTWARGAVQLHHLVDPRLGTSAASPWRTVSVAAASCVDANVAATASIVLGADAPSWLSQQRLPARLVACDGRVTYLADWPRPVA